MSTESHELRRWLAAGAQALARARQRLDDINVFPVPDSDTGTNMYLTVQEGNRAVAKLPATASHREVVAAFARGALLGARGNSGVILSQYLSALLRAIDELGGVSKVNPNGLASALREGADAAYGAVGAPVEGTMLSVARRAAEGAEREAATRGASRGNVMMAAVMSARAELHDTYESLPAAFAAGVVDAGGAGLLLQLEMLAETIVGPGAVEALGEVTWELAPSKRGSVTVQPANRHQGGAYEVMFVTRVENTRAALDAERKALSDGLRELGDSVAVTGTHGLVQAHVHTDDVDGAIDLGIAHHARQIVVTSLLLGNGTEDRHAPKLGGTGMVALTACPGVASSLADAGAMVLVIPNAATIAPKDVRRAVRDVSGRGVVVAAGSPQLRLAAREAVSKKSLAHVTVLDAHHEAHVVAAIAAGATATPGEPIAQVMAAAVQRCVVGQSSPDALDDDIDRLLDASTEVVTLILAEGIPYGVADAVRLSAAAVSPGADVLVLNGRHHHPPILLGVERA